MHPRNLHKNGYDFDVLTSTLAKLKSFLIKTPVGNTSIDFSDPSAVKTLNAALLAHHYGIKNWDIPADYLCPPVPGRADYIHHIADLLAEDTAPQIGKGKIPTGDSVIGLDIGVGANVIYPILGSQIYGWRFVGSELNTDSLKSANSIIQRNTQLANTIALRQQTNPKRIFAGIIGPQDQFDFTLCNPPFHASQKLAEQGSQRKNRNLIRNKQKRHNQQSDKFSHQQKSNFAGKSNELWCAGGEISFIKQMIIESRDYASQVKWFTSLVSKKENLTTINRILQETNVNEVKTVNMGQGSKVSRFIAWRF